MSGKVDVCGRGSCMAMSRCKRVGMTKTQKKGFAAWSENVQFEEWNQLV